jgi:methionine-rich copper-binding protein CopC
MSGTVVTDKNFGFAATQSAQGTASDDLIIGTNYGESLYGGNGADRITGLDGNDIFFGEGGDDTLNGGSGFDVANYSGFRSDYTISYANGYLGVADQRGISTNDGSDSIFEVESLIFFDQSIFVDSSAPTTTAFSPSDTTVNVAVGDSIILTFSEAIQKGTGNIEIRQGSATGSLIESFSPASNRATISGSTLTIDPTNSLSNSTQYFVVLPTGVIRDLAGNNYAGTSIYDFATVAAPDTTAPSVTAFSPSDAATGIAVGSNITLTFSEAIQRGAGNIEIRQGSATGTLVESFSPSSTRATISG